MTVADCGFHMRTTFRARLSWTLEMGCGLFWLTSSCVGLACCKLELAGCKVGLADCELALVCCESGFIITSFAISTSRI
jgi:hypothetical protein